MKVGNFSWMNSEGFRLFLGFSVLAGFTTYMTCRKPDYLKSAPNDRPINKQSQSYDRSNSSQRCNQPQ